MNLNPEQELAVKSLYGPVLIFAGAGSGKTRVIVHRIKNLIENSVSPHSIVAVTFTNKSAKEMKERLYSMLDKKKLKGIVVSTFHALGNKILQSEIDALDYKKPYSIFDENDKISILRNIYKELKLDPDEVKEDNIIFYISLFKNSNQKIDEWINHYAYLFKSYPAEIFKEIYNKYKKYLFSINSIDFDDLILLPIKILKNYPDRLEKYQKKFKFFLVDEFQDTNPPQYELLKILSEHTKNLCVVGDDDQSIYGWRGSDVSIIQNFQKDFPGTKVILLNKNYRSTQTILNVAYEVIKKNKYRVNKAVISQRGKGEKVKVIEYLNEQEEAENISEIIKNYINQGIYKPGDFAILFRTNYQSRALEVELRKRKISYNLTGAYRFFDRKEVKDIIAYLRIIANPLDDISLIRIINYPRRGIGDSTIEKIYDFIKQYGETRNKKISFYEALALVTVVPDYQDFLNTNQKESIKQFVEFIEHFRKEFITNRRISKVANDLVQTLKFEDEFVKDGDSEEVVKARMYNISEIINMIAFFEEEWDEPQPPNLFHFLSRISLLTSDNEKESPDKVQLMTLHLSKGLEFPVVFITGLNESIFPSERSINEAFESEKSLEEERRLFYVGITRAKDLLYITYTQTRKKYGKETQISPSMFLEELPSELTERQFVNYTEQEEKNIYEFINHLKSILVR